jgi:hypothetical protein
MGSHPYAISILWKLQYLAKVYKKSLSFFQTVLNSRSKYHSAQAAFRRHCRKPLFAAIMSMLDSMGVSW